MRLLRRILTLLQLQCMWRPCAGSMLVLIITSPLTPDVRS